MLSHSKVQFLLKVKCAKWDSFFYGTVLNIKRFDIALEHLHIKVRKNSDNINFNVVIVFDTICSNQA